MLKLFKLLALPVYRSISLINKACQYAHKCRLKYSDDSRFTFQCSIPWHGALLLLVTRAKSGVATSRAPLIGRSCCFTYNQRRPEAAAALYSSLCPAAWWQAGGAFIAPHIVQQTTKRRAASWRRDARSKNGVRSLNARRFIARPATPSRASARTIDAQLHRAFYWRRQLIEERLQ